MLNPIFPTPVGVVDFLLSMAHLVDLSEEQFRVLDSAEQCKLAKAAVVAALEYDQRVIKQFEDAIRQYHRALQYVNLVDSSLPDSEELLLKAGEYFKRQRFLKAQLEEMKKCPVPGPEITDATTLLQKTESLAIAVKGSVLTMHQTHRLGERAEKIKGDIVTNSKSAWTKTSTWLTGTVESGRSWWQTRSQTGEHPGAGSPGGLEVPGGVNASSSAADFDAAVVGGASSSPSTSASGAGPGGADGSASAAPATPSSTAESAGFSGIPVKLEHVHGATDSTVNAPASLSLMSGGFGVAGGESATLSGTEPVAVTAGIADSGTNAPPGSREKKDMVDVDLKS